jgi:hypothetical protein
MHPGDIGRVAEDRRVVLFGHLGGGPAPGLLRDLHGAVREAVVHAAAQGARETAQVVAAQRRGVALPCLIEHPVFDVDSLAAGER